MLAPVASVLTPGVEGRAMEGRSRLSMVPLLMKELKRTRPVTRTGYLETLSTLIWSCCFTSACRMSTFSAVSCGVGAGAAATVTAAGVEDGNCDWRAESSS
jgi:hypothetical protein